MADASDDVDFSKLKVPELKKLLKERGLPISGNKSELISRLKGGSGEGVMRDVIDDSVLDEEVLEASHDEEEKENTTTTVETTEALPSSVDTENIGQGESVPAKPPTIKIGALSEQERLEQRAKKFGVVSEDARKQLRAARFGVEGAKTTTAGKGADLDKLKQRAERFHSVTSSALSQVTKDEQLKKRAERFGISSTPAAKPGTGNGSVAKTDEKILKRKERFGAVITGPGGDVDAKKQKRAERFGIIAAP